MRREAIRDRFEHARVGVFVRGLELPAFEACGHRGAGLVGQAVRGDMLGPQGDRPIDIRERLGDGLSRDRVDEIDAGAEDPRVVRKADRTGHALGIVPAFERLEVRGIEGLGADAQPVHASPRERCHELRCRGLGVAFDGELAARAPVHQRAIERFVERAEQAVP